MSVLENFKNVPRSPYGGRQGSNVIFFQICNKFPGVKKRGGLSPPQWATGGPVALPSGDRWAQPTGAAGGLSPPRATGGPDPPPPAGDRGKPLYISSNPPLPSSFEPENSTKNPEKKRGVRRRKAAKPCRIQHL